MNAKELQRIVTDANFILMRGDVAHNMQAIVKDMLAMADEIKALQEELEGPGCELGCGPGEGCPAAGDGK